MGRSKKQINPKQGQNLKTLMKERGMTQTQFADVLGTQQQNISKYVTGKSEISASKAMEIAAIFDVNPAWVLGVDDNIENPIAEHGVRVWDAQDIAEEMLNKLGYEFRRTEKKIMFGTPEDTADENGKPLTVVHYEFDTDAPGAYELFKDGKKVCETSTREFDSIIDGVVDYAVYSAERLIEKRRKGNG